MGPSSAAGGDDAKRVVGEGELMLGLAHGRGKVAQNRCTNFGTSLDSPHSCERNQRSQASRRGTSIKHASTYRLHTVPALTARGILLARVKSLDRVQSQGFMWCARISTTGTSGMQGGRSAAAGTVASRPRRTVPQPRRNSSRFPNGMRKCLVPCRKYSRFLSPSLIRSSCEEKR